MKKFVIAAVLLVALAMVPGVMADTTTTGDEIMEVDDVTPVIVSVVYSGDGAVDVLTEDVVYLVTVTDGNGNKTVSINSAVAKAQGITDPVEAAVEERAFHTILASEISGPVTGTMGEIFTITFKHDDIAANTSWDFFVNVTDGTNYADGENLGAYEVNEYRGAELDQTEIKFSGLVPGGFITGQSLANLTLNTNVYVSADVYGEDLTQTAVTQTIDSNKIFLLPECPVCNYYAATSGHGLPDSPGAAVVFTEGSACEDAIGGYSDGCELLFTFKGNPSSGDLYRLPKPLPAGTYTGDWFFVLS